MTLGRRVAVGIVVLVSAVGLSWNLQRNVEVAAPPEWDWAGLEEDLDLLESLRPEGTAAWSERSDDLTEELDAVDRLPREELERHLGSVARLLAVAGVAAEEGGAYVWPRFGRVDGQRVNLSWYRAARLQRAHPDLWPVTADRSAQAAIDAYVRAMADGALPATDQIAPP